MSRERQVRKQEEIRSLIIDAAREIISKEGVQGLSIRKITNAIDYSPAIIYHYFKDKNEIIESIVSEGYGRILSSISKVTRNEDEPEKELREVFENYIRSSLEFSEEYKSIMLNDDPGILAGTGILKRDISKERKTMQFLCDNISRGIEKGKYSSCDAELMAQNLWTAAFGLIIRLIIEKDIPEEQVNRLIENHLNLILRGLITRKEG